MEEEKIIELEHISKEFPGILANDDISLTLKKGEIHALLGENGAGKSTLMSILFGMYQPTSGTIKIRGKTVNISNPNVANEYGIGMVHQHFKLVEVFTVLENIILGVEPINKCGMLKKKDAKKRVQELADKYEFKVDLDAKIEDITVSMQQKTEILKMLYRNNDILIFDEPTAVLTPQEIDELLLIMKNLAKEGKSILFISHKLDEILAVADTCSILRKGKLVATVDVKNTNKEELSHLMVGRDVSFTYEKNPQVLKDTVLKVRNLSMNNKLHKGLKSVDDVSFDVKGGEIVTIAGIDGNGQSDLIFGITGLEKVVDGKIFLNDKEITKLNIRKRNNSGISHIPEDRHKHGLILDYSLEDNFIVEDYWRVPFKKFIGYQDRKEIRKNSEKLIEQYDVRSGQGSTTTARSMSGGNQQKAIIAREIEREQDLLIAVQPTRGLDVGAIEYIHKQLLKERDKGKALLVVSYELDEVFSISDRILVMFKGEIVGELDPKTTTRNELGLYMAGAKHNYEFKEEN